MALVAVLMCSQAVAQTAPSVAPDALVRSLYKQVVARHPLGIPYGADMKVFAPYLSANLLQRFDLANACAADWRRQNPDPNIKPPPIDLYEAGIFSGEDEEAEPQAFAIERTDTAADGARVHVKLTWGATSETPLTWYVDVVAGRENGRPVVDDVIFLDDGGKASSRLSEALATGCDGPRWVGKESSKP
ncbi:MAG: hypothetical protein JF615_00460 [Asticcacaulis sp.]|nr:hypothetical protein [Asticcacaulis sp.]